MEVYQDFCPEVPYGNEPRTRRNQFVSRLQAKTPMRLRSENGLSSHYDHIYLSFTPAQLTCAMLLI